MEYKQWLNSLQVGDKVKINVGRLGKVTWQQLEIIKITPTRIIKTTYGYTFNKDGWERASDKPTLSKLYKL